MSVAVRCIVGAEERKRERDREHAPEMKAARMSPAGAYPCGNGPSSNSFSPMRTSSSDLLSSCGAACATTLRSQAVDAGSFHSGDERATYSSDRSDRA